MNISSYHERWPLKHTFTISRHSRTYTDVIRVSINYKGCEGIAECVPNAHYGETLQSVRAQIDQSKTYLTNPNNWPFARSKTIETQLPITTLFPNTTPCPNTTLLNSQNNDDDYLCQTLRSLLLTHMRAGAARNALDCALWDLQAKISNTNVSKLIGLAEKKDIVSAQTIGIGSRAEIIERVCEYSQYPLLKVKLAATEVLPTLELIHEYAPQAKIIIDANEAWSYPFLCEILPALEALPIDLIEQPIKAENDADLEFLSSPIPLCADESMHTREDLTRIKKRYDCINIKLDKSGGLSEALLILKAAKADQLKVMIGCMVGTSLSMSPAYLLAQVADFVDLDGPTLLDQDHSWGFSFSRGVMEPNTHNPWGQE